MLGQLATGCGFSPSPTFRLPVYHARLPGSQFSARAAPGADAAVTEDNDDALVVHQRIAKIPHVDPSAALLPSENVLAPLLWLAADTPIAVLADRRLATVNAHWNGPAGGVLCVGGC